MHTNIFKRMASFLMMPYKEDFIFLFIIFVLVGGPIAAHYITYGITYAIWESAHSFLLCYIAALLMVLMPSTYRRQYKRFFYAIAFFDCIIEIACFMVTKRSFSMDHVAIIMGTNVAESLEFFETYFSFNVVMVIIAVAVLVFVIFQSKIKSYINYVGSKFAIMFTIITILAFGYFIIKNSESWRWKFYTKIVAFISYDSPPDLHPYQREIAINGDYIKPDHIVFIIGESFAKKQSSLYGYGKDTNPSLASMSDHSLIYVYDDVSAPALNTIPCIKSILSTYKQDYMDSVNWYECETLPNIMSAYGYQTVWISNQSPSGIHDNIASRYADLCDTTFWVGSKVKGLDILAKEKSYIYADKCCILIHLMGSHYKFEDRYPQEYNKFTSEDYLMLSEEKRKIMATYDNSLVYNDFIVSEILNCFSDGETLAFYFPDHGLDLYDSSDNYYGHAIVENNTSVAVCKTIPFFVYMSTSFQEKYQEAKDYIITHSKMKFNTEDMIYFVCDVLGGSITMHE